MKAKQIPDDGMEWLRKLRLKLASECNYDLVRQRENYRAVAARQPHRSFRGDRATRAVKKVVHAVA